MPGRDERAWRDEGGPRDAGPRLPLVLAALMGSLEAESDRWFLWIPVLFAGGIISYFALADEPGATVATALVMAAIGLCPAVRGSGLGLVVGGAVLALAAGFATAKLRTEMARAPVLAKAMRGVAVKGWAELYEHRDKAKARITLRVIRVGELKPEETPYRLRVTLSAANGRVETGTLKATLDAPEPKYQ
jgi:competence protein ComEC